MSGPVPAEWTRVIGSLRAAQVAQDTMKAPAAAQVVRDDATARYARAGLQLLSVEGLCSGHPGLRAGSVVRIDGVGSRYGGLYYLHSVRHRYSLERGYETGFEGRRNAL